MPVFKIETGAVSGLRAGALVVPNGPLDAKSVSPFKAQIEALRSRRFKLLILEMGEVRYVNSTGLAYLITLAESLQDEGGAVALINVPPKVKLILETMGLLVFVRIYPSKSAAVKALKPLETKLVEAPATPAAEAPSPGTIRRLFRRLFGPPSKRAEG